MEKTVEILNRHKTPPAFNAAAFSGDGRGRQRRKVKKNY